MFERNSKYKWITILIVALFIAGLVYCGYQISSDNSKRNLGNQGEVSDTEDPSKQVMTGVVRELNTTGQMMSIWDINNENIGRFTYTGGTQILNAYNDAITMTKVVVGDIVDIEYNSKTNKISKLQISKEAWTYKNVDRMTINREENLLQLGETNYGYDDNLVVVSGDELISLLEVLSKDQVELHGIGNQVYSMIVKKGHGYIRFTGYDDFIGGSVSIGAGTYLGVSENMNVVIREGTYNVKMVNGELVGTKSVTVKRDEEVTVDMSEFKISNDRVGEVTFLITPDGADLNLNGSLVDYSEPIKLNYGEHKIIVNLSGYKEFAGILNVAQAQQSITINLVPETSEEESTGDDEVDKVDSDDIKLDWSSDKINSSNKPAVSPSTTPTNSSSDGEEDEDSSSKDSVKIDKSHKITVQSPEGVEVYFNNMYKGISPVSFTKVIGKGTISLKKEGYITKSYDVDVVNDDEDIFFKFQALKESN